MLWLYAALSKLLEFNRFRVQLEHQVFGQEMASYLLFLLPAAELLTAAFLLSKSLERMGLYLSASLLGIFTLYIGMVLAGLFSQVPCACGGVLDHLGWPAHFLLNVFFLALNLTAIIIHQRKEDISTEL